MVRVIRSNTDLESVRYKLEKPSLRNYVFSGKIDHVRNLMFGQVTKIAPYDDAEYYWAKVHGNGLIEFIYNGKIKDKMQMNSYDEDDYESVDDYYNDIIESAAEELKNFNKDIRPRMMYD